MPGHAVAGNEFAIDRLKSLEAGDRIVEGERARVIVNSIVTGRLQIKAPPRRPVKLEALAIAGVVVIAEITIGTVGILVAETKPHVVREALPDDYTKVKIVIAQVRVGNELQTVEIERWTITVAPA